jgi:hypothetical protein
LWWSCKSSSSTRHRQSLEKALDFTVRGARKSGQKREAVDCTLLNWGTPRVMKAEFEASRKIHQSIASRQMSPLLNEPTMPECPCSVSKHSPLCRSHTFIALSPLPVISREPPRVEWPQMNTPVPSVLESGSCSLPCSNPTPSPSRPHCR